MTANDFTFYTRADYFRELTRLAQEVEPGERIAVATMALDIRDQLVGDLCDSLAAAAGRGGACPATGCRNRTDSCSRA